MKTHMQQRHQEQLLLLLDQLYLEGHVTLSYAQLRYWFDAQRLSKEVYRTIIALWDELCVERRKPKVTIMVMEPRMVPQHDRITFMRDPFPREICEPLFNWANAEGDVEESWPYEQRREPLPQAEQEDTLAQAISVERKRESERDEREIDPFARPQR